MTRLIASCGLLAALAGCNAANTPTAAPTASQAAYGVEEQYVAAAHAETATIPLVSSQDKANIKAADQRAYDAVVKYRSVAEMGGSSQLEQQAAMDAIAALNKTMGR